MDKWQSPKMGLQLDSSLVAQQLFLKEQTKGLFATLAFLELEISHSLQILSNCINVTS